MYGTAILNVKDQALRGQYFSDIKVEGFVSNRVTQIRKHVTLRKK